MRRVGVLVGTCDLVGPLQHPGPLSLGAGPSPGRCYQLNVTSESLSENLLWESAVLASVRHAQMTQVRSACCI